MSDLRTVVLDDDPTGTQSAADVRVVFEPTVENLRRAFEADTSVYVLTNTRAFSEPKAVEIVRSVRSAALTAAAVLGVRIRFVLRGDSTLRGHVFAESEVFEGADSVLIFVPAFPDGGRTTVAGVHYVMLEGRAVPVGETEYAQDPVFPFRSSALTDYIREKSDRVALSVPLEQVRQGQLSQAILRAPVGSVVVPDAVNAEDIGLIAEAIRLAEDQREIVIRSGSPLAAELAGKQSRGLLDTEPVAGRMLLVCGSHTAGATAQLHQVYEHWPQFTEIDTDVALQNPTSAAERAAEDASRQTNPDELIILTTGRNRRPSDGGLFHGERVMSALTGAVAELLPQVDAVISKGGITSADVATVGIGARSALVEGQIAPGISRWRLTARDGREISYFVVPGNVGDRDALLSITKALTDGADERRAIPTE